MLRRHQRGLHSSQRVPVQRADNHIGVLDARKRRVERSMHALKEMVRNAIEKVLDAPWRSIVHAAAEEIGAAIALADHRIQIGDKRFIQAASKLLLGGRRRQRGKARRWKTFGI